MFSLLVLGPRDTGWCRSCRKAASIPPPPGQYWNAVVCPRVGVGRRDRGVHRERSMPTECPLKKKKKSIYESEYPISVGWAPKGEQGWEAQAVRWEKCGSCLQTTVEFLRRA